MVSSYAVNPGPSPGSTAYYLARFAPAPASEGIGLLLAWLEELESLRHLSDTTVALAKLQWWQEELARARGGSAQHPLFVALGDSASEHLDLTRLDRIPAAYGRHLSSLGYADPEDVAAHHVDTMGELAALLADLAVGRSIDHGLARAVGGYFGAVDSLRRLGAELRALRPLIPRSSLVRHGVTSPAAMPRSAALIEDLCTQAAALRPTGALRPPTPLGGMLAVADALLAEVRRSGPLVYEAAIDLTPLRKLWLVWRNR